MKRLRLEKVEYLAQFLPSHVYLQTLFFLQDPIIKNFIFCEVFPDLPQ
jgi:hypothetical protein